MSCCSRLWNSCCTIIIIIGETALDAGAAGLFAYSESWYICSIDRRRLEDERESTGSMALTACSAEC